MAFEKLKYNGKTTRLHKAIVTPDFNDKSVLVRNPWDYVEMWLEREGHDDSIEYWTQAKNFYQISLDTPNTVAPLTLYYSLLNATKALLKVKKIQFAELHGAQGQIQPGNTNLKNEMVTFQPNGILSSLCRYFGEPCNNDVYSLKNLLYNLPFIHRAFNLTFPTGYEEIFIPISNPHFVIMKNSHKAWFCAELSETFANGHTLNKFAPRFEQDLGVTDKFVIRRVKRFDWYKSGPDKKKNLGELTRYHKNIRKEVQYINGPSTLWYLKRTGQPNCIDRNPMTIIFASMHRLSELARYQPTVLYRHFEMKQNWLLSEFIKSAPNEFIDQIACEITNQHFLQPAIRFPV